MGIRKYRLSRKNSDGSYDTIHYETSSNIVVRPDGTSVEEAIIELLNIVPPFPKVGDVITSARIIEDDNMIPCDGRYVNSSDYPELAKLFLNDATNNWKYVDTDLTATFRNHPDGDYSSVAIYGSSVYEGALYVGGYSRFYDTSATKYKMWVGKLINDRFEIYSAFDYSSTDSSSIDPSNGWFTIVDDEAILGFTLETHGTSTWHSTYKISHCPVGQLAGPSWQTHDIYSPSSDDGSNCDVHRMRHINGLYFVLGQYYDGTTSRPAIFVSGTLDGPWTLLHPFDEYSSGAVIDIAYSHGRYIVLLYGIKTAYMTAIAYTSNLLDWSSYDLDIGGYTTSGHAYSSTHSSIATSEDSIAMRITLYDSPSNIQLICSLDPTDPTKYAVAKYTPTVTNITGISDIYYYSGAFVFYYNYNFNGNYYVSQIEITETALNSITGGSIQFTRTENLDESPYVYGRLYANIEFDSTIVIGRNGERLLFIGDIFKIPELQLAGYSSYIVAK